MARGRRVAKGSPWDVIAREAIDQVVSPVADSVRLPLLDELASIDAPGDKVAADLGCGPGLLLPRLLSSFREVVAIDSSREMLALARDHVVAEHGELPSRLRLERGSLTGLRRFASGFDVAIAQNSILMLDPRDVQRALRAIRRSLAPGGVFLGVFPAVESMAEAFRFCYGVELARCGGRHSRAWSKVQRALRSERMNFALGIYDAGYLLEKYYSRYELETALSRAGFGQVAFDRVVYQRRLRFEGAELYGDRVPAVWHHSVKCS